MTIVLDMTDEATVASTNTDSVVKPYVLSHGTLACHDLNKTRAFYEEFLGMTCVQHGITSMAFRCGIKFHVVCLQMGEEATPCHLHNHWGLDVTSEAEVDAAYQAAVSLREKYGIKELVEPAARHGVYSFYMEDLDSNWWEIQYYPGFQHDDMFDFGDRFTPDGKAVTGA